MSINPLSYSPWSSHLVGYMFVSILILLTRCVSLGVLLRTFFSSGIRNDLRKISSQISHHVNHFDREVQQAERGRSLKADETTHEMLKGMRGGTPSANKEPKFPVRSVNIEENKSFVGRTAELDEMYKCLVQTHQDARPKSCVLHGIGGVGKTQTALRFLYQYDKRFDAILWVSADPEKETEIQRTFCNIGVQLGLFGDGEEITDSQINGVFQWLCTTGKIKFSRASIPGENVRMVEHVTR